VATYKHAVSTLLDEFFASGDTAEAARTLAELGHPLYAHVFVKRAVRSLGARTRIAWSGAARAHARTAAPHSADHARTRAAARQVATALDRGPREKEQVALLLSACFPSVVAADQLAKARASRRCRCRCSMLRCARSARAAQHQRAISAVISARGQQLTVQRYF
jgi:hypothetical protein